MSAFPASKLDNELVGKAVTALMKYEVKKTSEGANGKALLVSNYAKPVLVQVRNLFIIFNVPCSQYAYIVPIR
jgi:hypothetical protein